LAVHQLPRLSNGAGRSSARSPEWPEADAESRERAAEQAFRRSAGVAARVSGGRDPGGDDGGARGRALSAPFGVGSLSFRRTTTFGAQLAEQSVARGCRWERVVVVDQQALCNLRLGPGRFAGIFQELKAYAGHSACFGPPGRSRRRSGAGWRSARPSWRTDGADFADAGGRAGGPPGSA